MALNLHHTKNELFRPNEIDRKVAYKHQVTDTSVRWTLMRVLKHDTIKKNYTEKIAWLL